MMVRLAMRAIRSIASVGFLSTAARWVVEEVDSGVMVFDRIGFLEQWYQSVFLSRQYG